MGRFTVHAFTFSPGGLVANIETSMALDANELRAKLRQISGIRIVNVQHSDTQWMITIAHQEVNPHPLAIRICNILENAYNGNG